MRLHRLAFLVSLVLLGCSETESNTPPEDGADSVVPERLALLMVNDTEEAVDLLHDGGGCLPATLCDEEPDEDGLCPFPWNTLPGEDGTCPPETSCDDLEWTEFAVLHRGDELTMQVPYMSDPEGEPPANLWVSVSLALDYCARQSGAEELGTSGAGGTCEGPENGRSPFDAIDELCPGGLAYAAPLSIDWSDSPATATIRVSELATWLVE